MGRGRGESSKKNNSALATTAILYGHHSRAQTNQSVLPNRDFSKIDIKRLEINPDGYFENLNGFSGCGSWFVFAEQLPKEMIHGAEYDQDIEPLIEELLNWFEQEESLDFDLPSCSVKRLTDDINVIRATDHESNKMYQIPACAHKMEAVKQLSETEGSWRLYVQNNYHELLYLDSAGQLKGSVEFSGDDMRID